ncbi:hypothetical protein EV421DRAFT_1895442 [Armillaria borealis]|uniref:Uncharacterized protein n=1 Tax=Armillaria borealis TaxID=47425 RepID=A0AA39K8E0_9AGAR|nr:hypothetical protein EV421DRAFT_1895442 [Armillaria borealis]
MVKTITSSKNLPYFEEFHLNLSGAVFPDPTLRLRGLHGLRKINVTHDIPFSSKSDDFERSILKPLSYSFATSPELTEICITSSVPLRLSVSHLLRRIQDPSALKVLALGAFRFDSDVNMTPYLGSLTSLSLLPVKDLGVLETAVPARFWEELRAPGAQLQELLLGGLDDDSLNFLERFPGKGLEKLSVIIQSNNGYRRFYDDVLARHAATLRELWIRIKDDRPWYLDSRNAQAVSKCKNLKVLGVSFLSGPSSVMNVINQLPETLPDLDVLYLAEVDLRPGQHIVCGPRGSVRTYIRSVPKDEVMKNVVEYDFQAPSGKEFLGRIVVRFAWDDEVIIYALGDPEEKSRNQRLREGSCDDQQYFAVSGFRTIFDYVNV